MPPTRLGPGPAEPGSERLDQTASRPDTAAPGLTVESNPGQIVQNTGPGTAHAPVNPGTYIAQQVAQAAQAASWPVRVEVVPQLADRYQPQTGVQQQLEEHLEAGVTAVLTQTDGGRRRVG